MNNTSQRFVLALGVLMSCGIGLAFVIYTLVMGFKYSLLAGCGMSYVYVTIFLLVVGLSENE